MKVYFYLGIGIIITLIVGLFGYSVFLNHQGENVIADRMAKHHLPLKGITVNERTLLPIAELDLVNLYSDNMTDVVALENGRIVNEFVQKNSHVAAGAVILQMVNEDLPLKIRQADSDIVEAEAQLVKARNSYNRYKQLVDHNAISLEKYDEAEAVYKAAQARMSNLEAQRAQLLARQARQMITTPIAGEVLNIYHKTGSYVNAGTAVALVGDFSSLSFAATMNDRLTKKLYIGREFQLTISGNEGLHKSYGANLASGNQGDNQTFRVKVEKITPELSEPATMRQVIWQIDNRVGLLEPGAYSKVVLHSDLPHKCLAIPVGAFVNEGMDQVAVVDEDGRLAMRYVETGITDGKYIEIRSGLVAGDTLITSDTEGIDEGTQIEIVLEDN